MNVFSWFNRSGPTHDERVERVRRDFAFLEADFAFALSFSEYRSQWSDTPNPLLEYKSESASVLIEIEPYADGNTLELYLRRLIHGIPSPWRDNSAHLSLDDLDIHTHGTVDRTRIGDDFDDRLTAATNLLKANVGLLTGTEWFSRDAIEDLRNKDLHRRLGLNRSGETANQRHQREFRFLVSEFGFQVTSDSDDLPPFGKAWEDAIILERDDVKIEIGLYGGRDRYFQVKYNQHVITGTGKGWNYPDQVRDSIIKSLRKRLRRRFGTEQNDT